MESPFDPRIHTADGLHIGSREQDVVKTLGAPDRQADAGTEHFLIYNQRGVVFLVVNDRKFTNYGLVNQVWVFAAKPAS